MTLTNSSEMPSSTLRKFRLCPASSAGALLSVLALFVALAAATTTNSQPTLGPNGTTYWNYDDFKCEFVPKWLIRIAGYANGSFDNYDIGVRLNSEYLLAHLKTIRYADEHFPFNSTNVTKLPDAVFNFNPSIFQGRVIRGEEGGYARGYYPELVMKLTQTIGLYRIKTRSFLESEFGPVADRFPLEKTEMPKLLPPVFKPSTNECYVLTWTWKFYNDYPVDGPLLRVPVIMEKCYREGFCIFRPVDLPEYGSCRGDYFYNTGAPVLCSNGKEDIVTHVLSFLFRPPIICRVFIAYRLAKFLPEIQNKTGYKRPDESFCPVC